MSAAPAPARLPRGTKWLERPHAAPTDGYPLSVRRVSVPASDSPDPARAAWVEALLTDPAGARREQIVQKARYWQRRLAQHEEKLASIREQLDQALYPARDVRQAPVPAATIFELRVQFSAVWADVQAARARLAEAEHELAQA